MVANATAMESIREAQFRNLAIATEVIAAKCRAERILKSRKQDLEEPPATRNAGPETGPLAAQVESNLPWTAVSRHSDPSALERPFPSRLIATLDTEHCNNMKPRLPGIIAETTTFRAQRIEEDLSAWGLGKLNVVSGDDLFGCALCCDEDAIETLPTVRFPSSPCCPILEELSVASSLNCPAAVPISPSTKPMFVFDDVHLSVRCSKKQNALVWIRIPKTCEAEARIVELEIPPRLMFVGSMHGEEGHETEPDEPDSYYEEYYAGA